MGKSCLIFLGPLDSFAFGCFETKLPGCILKRVDPPSPQKINQMNSCHPSDNCFRTKFCIPKKMSFKNIPRAPMTSVFEGQLLKTRPFHSNQNKGPHLASRYILYIPILLVPAKQTLVIMTSATCLFSFSKENKSEFWTRSHLHEQCLVELLVVFCYQCPMPQASYLTTRGL